MAPPERPFPVSELEDKIHGHTINYKEKSRKLPKDFDLKKDCELMELVQYSCTTPTQQMERALASGSEIARMECFPIVRLFRKCVKGGKVFHVETTAWEGDLAWKPPMTQNDTTVEDQTPEQPSAGYWSSFWSKK
ncbi:hypothetical protein H2200_011376 [Cladophialophora chaetospira]|uniref:Uncharacterized protein n=1 Tax=Cladophialophora chaetospira TaxID=386627 RepID=A0AA38WZ82_9EURO|nr:hypothetical protein H2200_011376 [Cladophialophora chaetospira]